jgi:hypothetical protein
MKSEKNQKEIFEASSIRRANGIDAREDSPKASSYP